ncbi:MAG: DUF2332 domain-containing protein [Bacteroidota bacterium]
MNHPIPQLSQVKESFLRLAEQECKDVSPLYYYLSQNITQDDRLLAIAQKAKYRQPIPNLFLGAVHYLLFEHKDHDLAKFYPSIHPGAIALPPFELFRSFCLAHQAAIEALLRTKIVQTNAINRCAYLMPIFSQLAGSKAWTIIDIGASAGLNLNFDLYTYQYNGGDDVENPTVIISSKIKDGEMPNWTSEINIKQRIGIDQNPIDLKDPSQANWLKALIWADQTKRFQRLEKAIAMQLEHPITLFKEDRIEGFRRIIDRVNEKHSIFLYHTHVLYQFTKAERVAFWQMLDELGAKRDLEYLAVENYRILENAYGQEGIPIVLTSYRSGNKEQQLIGKTNGHANWIEWV